MDSCRQIRVIGIGNEWRGDDGAGIMVVRYLNVYHPGRLSTLELPGDASELFTAWQGVEVAFIADTVKSNGPPGEIYRLAPPWNKPPLLLSALSSSHAFGLAQALALGEVLSELPPVLVIYGIAGQKFQPGRGLTREVAAAVPEVARRILAEINQCLGATDPGTPPQRRSGL